MFGRRFALCLPVVIGLAALVACRTDDRPSHEFSLARQNDIRVATTRGGPRFAGPLFAFDAELTLQQDPGRLDSPLYNASGFIVG